MSDTVFERLQGDATPALVGLVVDHLLAQPVEDLIDPDTLASQIVAALEQVSESEQTEAWFREQVDQIRTKVPDDVLRDTIPEDMVTPLRNAIMHPFVPDRAIVGRLMGHGAIEALLRTLLVGSLQSFAQRIRPAVPGSSGRRLKSLKRMGEGVLGGLGQEIERQAEQRVKDFVDTILGQVLGQAADHLCDPRHAETYGRFRGHMLDQILDTPLSDLQHEVEKLDPDALVSSCTAAARGLANRDGFEDEIAGHVRTILDGLDGKSMGDFLQEAGIAPNWREKVETQLAKQAKGFMQTPGFKDWLSALLDD